MPWKGEHDPYRIWLSEIILQQTRVQQGRKYYVRFIDKYPTVCDLANAPLDDVLSLWEGLGYYSRARNLHHTAKHVCRELNGIFPDTMEGLLALKGVGPYTAAAIGSFAFGLPVPVLDGNSLRVISRFLGSSTPIDTSAGKSKVRTFLEKAIPEDRSGEFNQAIMDFGATVCKPRKPFCEKCPLKIHCRAYQEEEVEQLPVKSKKLKRKKRYFHYLYLNDEQSVLLDKRQSSDIWRGLYQLPMREKDKRSTLSSREICDLFNLPFTTDIEFYSHQKQQLTHQEITGYFYGANLPKGKVPNLGKRWVETKNLTKFAFPKLVRCFLDEKQLTLDVG